MQIYIFIEPKFRPDKHHLCMALEAMKVAGETLQKCRRTSPAAGSYLQPWRLVPLLVTDSLTDTSLLE